MPIWDDVLSVEQYWARQRYLLRSYNFRHFMRWLKTTPRMWTDCGPYGKGE